MSVRVTGETVRVSVIKAAHLEGRGGHALRRLDRKVDLLDRTEDLIDLQRGRGGCGGGASNRGWAASQARRRWGADGSSDG